jgi:hypothetical protein
MAYVHRSLIALLFLSLSSYAISADDWQRIRSDSGSLLLKGATDKRVLQVRGKWLSSGSYNLPRIALVNAAWILCEEATGTCRESNAQVAKTRNAALDIPPILSVSEYRYEILEWSKDVVVAKRVTDAGQIDATLTVNHKSGSISLTHRERPDNNAYFQPAEQTYTMKIDMLFGS